MDRVEFIENKGQWNDNVIFKAQIPAGNLYLENDALTYLFYDERDIDRLHELHHNEIKNPTPQDYIMNLHAFKINFLNAHTKKINAKEPTSDYVNYYLGNDKSKWASNVKKYSKTSYQNIYDSIDLKFYLKEGFLKYDFIVAPGGDPSDIQLDYEGVDGLFLEKGALKITTSVNEIIEQKPYAYQLINGVPKKVKCNFKLEGTTVSFDFPKGYDISKKLIIDPTLVFASYSGSTMDNWGYTSTFDDAGHLYGGGATFGIGYPTTPGAFQLNFAGGNGGYLSGTDITITKFSPDGTSLIYSTYLGGAENESPHSLIVNNNNELLILGTTASSNFPITTAAYDTSFGGGTIYTVSIPNYISGSDMVIAKINTNGDTLLSSTYMGGSENDGLNVVAALQKNYADDFRGEIIIDDSNNVYVASSTLSSDFPITTGVFQPTFSGIQDGCVFKLNPDLSTLIWSTYIGGSSSDAGYSLQFDEIGNILITGGTVSSDFPTTGGVIQPTFQGVTDGWIAKINSTATSLIASTYIGTPAYDQCYFIQLDTANNVYVIGQTEGTYPIAPSTVYNNPNSGQFIHKLTPNLSNTVFSTTFGTSSGEIDIALSAFLVNECNYILISGWGGATNVINGNAPFSTTNGLPVTSNAIQPTTDGSDYYLTMFNEDADSLLFATFFGGTTSNDHVDGGTSRFDKKGIVYQAVCASCGFGNTADFPATTGAHSTTNNSSNCNLGVFKFDLSQLTADADVYTTPYYCIGDTVHFQNLSNGGVTFTWDFGDGTPNSNTIEPFHAFTTSGTYNVRLIALDAVSCIFQDTDYVEVFIGAAPIATALPANGICPGDSIMINVSGGDSSIWITNYNILNDTLPTATVWPDTSMIYTGVTFNRCGSDTTEILVTVFENNTSITADTTICDNMSLQIVASGGNSYLWSPAATLNNPNIATPTATPGITTTYNVTITDINTCVWDTFMTITTISLPPIADAGHDTQVCLGDSVQLNATGGSTYNWDFSLSMSNPNISNPYVFPTQNTSYFVEVMNACGINRDSVLVNVSTVNPRAWPDTIVCSQQEIQLFSSGGTAVNWEPQNEVSQTQNGYFVSPTEPTTYTVTIENTFGCRADTFVTIGVYPLPFLEAGPDQWIAYENVFLEGTGVGTFAWTPSPFLSCDTCQNTQVFIDQTTVFTVSLTDSFGCVSTDELTIYVPGEIYAPNAFTPNGDGKNELFFLKTYQIDQFDLQIFNRWGQLLFQTEDKTEGWDGYYKGDLSKNDVYIWKVKYTDILGERNSKMGTVTLVR